MREVQNRNLNPIQFDRVAVLDQPFFNKNEKFTLKDGYYYNEDQTVFMKSSFLTGRIFKLTNAKI